MTAETSRQRDLVDIFASALQGTPCHVVVAGGVPRPLPVHGWTREVDAADRAVLDECVGSTLDVGCGPGRMAAHLAERGHSVLAIDIVPEAIRQARVRGAEALLRSVFAPLPGEGRWDTALLADGNIGIGGDPVVLLRRVAELLAPQGRVVIDLDPPGTGWQRHMAHLEVEGARSAVFPWALVGPDALPEIAELTGLRVGRVREFSGRWFAVMHR